MTLGTLYPAISSRQCARNSSAVTVTPACGTTIACTASPHRSSGTPKTAALFGHQGSEHRGNRKEDRHPMAADEIEAQRRVEHRRRHGRAAQPGQPGERGNPGDVEHGRCAEEDIVGLERKARILLNALAMRLP